MEHLPIIIYIIFHLSAGVFLSWLLARSQSYGHPIVWVIFTLLWPVVIIYASIRWLSHR